MEFTKDHKKNLREAKLKSIESKYKLDLIEPYMDVKIDNGRRNRRKKFVTFREFKRLRLEEGKSLKELSAEGYSRQSLGFCSRFVQGIIKLSKEDFEKEYRENDLDYISNKYGIDRGDVACLRQMYNINSTSGPYFKRIKEEIPLTQRQIEILYGSMLGDACGDSGKRISFKHGDCQREYIFWKYDEFKEHCNSSTLKARRNFSEKYNLDNIYWSFRTKFHSEFEKCIKLFYREGKKEVCREIIENLTPLSIAVWFMDDGTTNFNHKVRQITNQKITPQIYFCTDSFSAESCDLLVSCLKNGFNINSRIRTAKRLKNGEIPYNIVVNKESIIDFIEIIDPYIIPSMRYKVDYEAYKRKVVEK